MLDAAELQPDVRLSDGAASPGGMWEYGRLEIFANGFWSNVCNREGFTPDAAQVACKALGYNGGAVLSFTQAYTFDREVDRVIHYITGTLPGDLCCATALFIGAVHVPSHKKKLLGLH